MGLGGTAKHELAILAEETNGIGILARGAQGAPRGGSEGMGYDI